MYKTIVATLSLWPRCDTAVQSQKGQYLLTLQVSIVHTGTATSPANTKLKVNVVLTLGQRRRRCTNIKMALGQRFYLMGLNPELISLLK